ncbi:MAG TPA: hypothetical protein VGG28_23270 [Kofleriaceae bacterium]|jgi:hypothetical protein
MSRLVSITVLFGCGSGAPPHPVADHAVGSAVAPAIATAYRAESGDFAKGDVQVRVEWPDAPTVARASPGRTRCGTASAPDVAPTTTWGVPDAIVAIDADRGKPIVDPAARVVVADCAIAPRVVVAGAAITVASEVDHPLALSLARAGDAQPLEVGSATPAIALDLPISGHALVAPLAAKSLDLLAGSDVEPAWIVTPAQPYVAITEASGQVVLRDVPVGSYTVEALVPPRAGQPARSGRATVAVTANALADVTVQVR